MLLKNTPQGFENKGFSIDFSTSVSDRLYQVIELRNRSLLETLAFILGSMAGLVFVARVFKSWFGNKEYFRAKDREADMLFGTTGRMTAEQEREFKAQVEMTEQRNKQVRSFDQHLPDFSQDGGKVPTSEEGGPKPGKNYDEFD